MVAACQKADNVVVDSPQIINAQSLTFVGSDSIDVANYNTSSGASAIGDSFLISLSSKEGFLNLTVLVENDSGVIQTQQSFSSLHGDSIGGRFSFTPTSLYVGNLTYTFTPYNDDGTPGNYVTQVVRMYNSKAEAAVIDSVSAPDSVQISQTDTIAINIFAYVHDINSLNDISEVYFNSTLPSGGSGGQFKLLSQNPIGNEGFYALTIGLPPLSANNPPPLGTYTFTFYATNRSDITSYPFPHKITVYK